MKESSTTLSKKKISIFLTLIFLFQIIYIQPMQASNILSSDDNVEARILTAENSSLTNTNNKNEKITLPANTPISLKVENSISTRTAKVGDIITLRVAYNVMKEGQIVIPAGSIAKAQISYLKKPKIFGKAGEIRMAVESLIMPNGNDIKISANELNNQGDSKAAVAWVCFGVSLIILWPLIFVPFLIKGKDAEINANTTVEAFTTSDVLL
nr:hypothetical protein [uncultured Bacteroides sp.]